MQGGAPMRVSTRGEYGLRALLDLALRFGEGPIPLKAVARRQDISEHYLEQLMSTLRKASLVVSVRGAQGGYQLAAPPEETRVGDVLRALEGPLEPRSLEDKPSGEGSDHVPIYGTRVLWQLLAKQMNEMLDGISLADLLREGARLQADDSAYMYHI